MAMEWRKGRLYYYRSERVGGRVVKRYGGAGRTGELCAAIDAMTARERELEREEARDLADRRQRRRDKVYKLLKRASRLVGEALRAAGWHQHKREWRKRRGGTVGADLATMIDSWVPADLQARAGEIDPAVSKAAAAGDTSSMPAVRRYLDNRAAVALWGDAGRSLLRAWVKRFAGTDLLTQAARLRCASDLRAGLVGGSPDPLVRVLAERVVIAWVAASFFERWYAQALDKDQTFAAHRHHQRTVDFAHRQLLAAARTLAKGRRAHLPDVLALVNVAPPAASDPATGG